jgi:hypothetical protein
MSPIPMMSQAALAAGVPARFLYWTGRSGRRYLFTQMDRAAAELDGAVAIAASGERIVWVGQTEELARPLGEAPPRRESIYVHLLASTLAEQRGVIWDLRPAPNERPLPLAA